MSTPVPSISTTQLLIALLPAVTALALLFYWRAQANRALYATVRMLVQLFLIGYILIALFESDRYSVILAVLIIMLASASWIAVQPLAERDSQVLFAAFIAIAVGGVSTLVLVTQGVLEVQPWFAPRYVLPLGGMIFASAMNAVSLAAERLESEREKGLGIMESRRVAFQASMIPMINSFFAVGLVTLPGMMTGQVLSGVSPLVAAQYQIVVMSMLFGASGVASAIYLAMRARQLTPTTTAL